MNALVETSCLLRLPRPDDPRREATQTALDTLKDAGCTLVVFDQNLIEFRGVATRPLEVNGFGLSPLEADGLLDQIEQVFTLLPDPPGLYLHWRNLCLRAAVSGKQVHDTRLGAACAAAGVEIVLTWNPSDFRRFIPFVPGLVVVTPTELLTGNTAFLTPPPPQS